MGNGGWSNVEQHIARPSEIDIERVKSIGDPEQFVKQDKDFKRKYYSIMLQNIRHILPDMRVIAEPYGRLTSYGVGSVPREEAVNPYDPEGKKKILSALNDPHEIGRTAREILSNPIYKDAFGDELQRAAKEIYEHSEEKKIIEEEAKNGWVDIHDMVQRHPELQYAEYGIIPALIYYSGKYDFPRWNEFKLKDSELRKAMLNGYHLVIRCGKIQGRRKE
jgi:hypothetical protein